MISIFLIAPVPYHKNSPPDRSGDELFIWGAELHLTPVELESRW